MKKNSRKYINYIDNQLVYECIGNKLKEYKNINLLSIPKFNLKNFSLDRKYKNLIHFKWNDKKYCLFFSPLIDSGIENNHKKRIIVNQKNSIPNNFNFAIPILYYFAGIDNIVYIRFKDLNKFVISREIKNKSIWVDFSIIFYCLDKNKSVIYSNNKDTIYFSKNFFSLLEISENDFEKIKASDLDKINYDFKVRKNKLKNVDSILNKNPFTIKSKNNNAVINYKNDGRYAEELFFKILNNKNERELVENKINKKIKKIIWNNQIKESYLPYDFLINDNIFFEVKGTEKGIEHFVISENEWNFKNENNESYYLINFINLGSKKMTYKIYNSIELDKINFIKSIKYISLGETNE